MKQVSYDPRSRRPKYIKPKTPIVVIEQRTDPKTGEKSVVERRINPR